MMIMPYELYGEEAPPAVVMVPADCPQFLFVELHNQLAVEFGRQDQDRIPDDLDMHQGAVVGVPGMRFVSNPYTGAWVGVLHTGNVVIGDDCQIGSNSVVHRGVYGTTEIGRGTKIGSLCSIGHGARLGEYCLLTASVGISGSASIGNRVIFGIGSVVKHGVRICSDVMVGAGAVVIRDITESGTYAGVPAKKISDEKEKW